MSKLVRFLSTDKDLHQKAVAIRTEVFVQEQGVDEALEIENEDEAVHFLLFYKSNPIAAARYRTTENGIKLERFAMLKAYRGMGLGNDLLRFVLFHARQEKKPIYLNAQHQVIGYYEKWGFVKEGDAFYEANIQHYKMIYRPKDNKESVLPKAVCRR
jgi:predicted GNAT family N-acyltransferase